MLRLIVPVLFLAMVACGGRTNECCDGHHDHQESVFSNPDHQTFIDNLGKLCGNSYQGQQVYRSHHGSSWADKLILMHVEVCDHEKVHIAFHVDEDRYRTWMFFVEDGNLTFRHRYLNEDGTQMEGSMYGGYATEEGSGFVQYFPADEFTGSIIDGGGGNLWTVSIAEDFSTFSYRLDRDGEKRFEIVFDLNKPLEK